MRDYDQHTREHLPSKIPDWSSPDPQRRVGDSIYDFSGPAVEQRRSLHGALDLAPNLSGGYVLLSDHFYYFGIAAPELPAHLADLAKTQRGHRAGLNDRLFEPFTTWLHALGLRPGTIVGEPLLRVEIVDERPGQR